jgi:hypothetical protein
MLPLTAMTATSAAPAKSPWLTSIYAGLVTAILTLACSYALAAAIPILYIPLFLLIGAGPVLGYQIAFGQPGRDWKPIIGGVLGMIIVPLLFVLWPGLVIVIGAEQPATAAVVGMVVASLCFVLWPVLVGAMSKDQSIGRLFLGSVIGAVIFVVVFLALGFAIGQAPSWVRLGFTLAFSAWGGTCGAAMAAWRKS